MDSDLQDRPEDIKLFIKYIEKDYDLIIGIRKLSISSSVLNVCSFIYNRAFRYILNCNLTILSSSFVAFKFKYLTNLPWYKNDHRYLPAIAIDRGAKKLKQIKIKHQKRKFGHSKYNTFKKIFFGIPEVIIFFFRLKLKSYK